MSFEFGSGLQPYVDEKKGPLRQAAVLDSVTLQNGLIPAAFGLKAGTTALPNIASNISLSQGSCLNTYGQSGITITQTNISMTQQNVLLQFCTQELEGIFLRSTVSRGSYNAKSDVYDDFLGMIKKDIAKEYDRIIWAGTAASDGTTGLINQAAANSASTTNYDIDVANISHTDSSVLRGVILSAETQITNVLAHDDLAIYMSEANLRRFRAALFNDNWFHLEANSNDSLSFQVPGTRTTAYALPSGFNGENRMLFGPKDVFVAGSDVGGEETNPQFWYDLKDDKYYFRSAFKTGAACHEWAKVGYIF
jgi:hypothetical protein